MKGIDMREQLTGMQIVEALSGDREYWRATAGDLSSWISELPPAATANLASRTEWIGNPWDGRSDLQVGSTAGGATYIVERAYIRELLDELRRGMADGAVCGHCPPDANSVRVCRIGSGMRAVAVIDFDMVDFVLPLCIHDGEGRPSGGQKRSAAAAAAGMLGKLREADAMRHGIARREQGLRRTLQQTARRIGDGAAPLWLRLQPVPEHERIRDLCEFCYVMILLLLDDNLTWVPQGDERIFEQNDIRGYEKLFAHDQRRRGKALRRLAAEGSRGSISQIALALIQEKGLNPSDVFDRARDAALQDLHGGVAFERDDAIETLFIRSGVLSASFHFPGGFFHGDTLTLWDEYPPSVQNSTRGRALADFVGHPAFMISSAKALKGEARQNAFDVVVADRHITVEEATRRFLAHAPAAESAGSTVEA